MQCDCSVDFGDGPECFAEKIVKARIEHQCGECGETILKGQKYEYCRGLWEDSWSTHKTCIGCRNLRDHLCPDGFSYGGLKNQIQDCLGFDFTDVNSYPTSRRERFNEKKIQC